jgi:hypothetical protein
MMRIGGFTPRSTGRLFSTSLTMVPTDLYRSSYPTTSKKLSVTFEKEGWVVYISYKGSAVEALNAKADETVTPLLHHITTFHIPLPCPYR